MILLLKIVRAAFIATAIFVLGASAWIWMTNPTQAMSLALLGIALLTAVAGFLWESRMVTRATAVVSIIAAMLSWEPIRGALGI